MNALCMGGHLSQHADKIGKNQSIQSIMYVFITEAGSLSSVFARPLERFRTK